MTDLKKKFIVVTSMCLAHYNLNVMFLNEIIDCRKHFKEKMYDVH